ncbi:hypothetical protein N7456_006370 [Penicillium angulare]|uniref:Uncharacterized protein n=1 Tax=Penicillium angulare TaxID=116970 RepID=A0A9W9KBV4_9EURO|nr:hypothetical protein N7456_006370 [Penicillium angulare]
MNLLFPKAYHTPAALQDDPAPWATALKDQIKNKYKNRSSVSSSSTKTMSDAASTHSTVSTATTLKGSALDAKKKKWYSLNSKSSETLNSETKFVKDSDKEASQKAIHNEALASYFSTR